MNKEYVPTLQGLKARAVEFLADLTIGMPDQRQPDAVIHTYGGVYTGLAGVESLDELMSACDELDQRAADDIAASQSNGHGL